MSKFVSLFLTSLLVCGTLASPALALDNQSPAPAVNAGSLKKSVPTKLTKEECEGAGGKVESVADCPTGAACFRADQDHVVHVRCLSKKP